MLKEEEHGGLQADFCGQPRGRAGGRLGSRTERVRRARSACRPGSTRRPEGHWLITEGLAPVGVSHFFIGLVIDKPDGISNIETQNFAKAENFNERFRWEDFPEGWDPAARLRAQDRDGVEAEILYASPARFFYGLTDAPFQHAILQSYNAWLHEFCSHDPRRLVGVPLLTILDMDQTVKDVYELAKQGFRLAQIPSAIKDSGYYEPFYEPLWRAAADAGLVLSIHTTSTQGQARTHFEGPREVDPRTVPLGHARLEDTAQRFMGHLIFRASSIATPV